MSDPVPVPQRRQIARSRIRTAGKLLAALVLVAGLPAEGAIFTVTRFDDQVDTSPGNGLCVAANGGGCSLRAAIQEANSLFGPDSIYLPAGTYTLTRAGAGEDLAATGDLDVTSEITLVGTGWRVTAIEMAGFNDRLFEVHGFSSLELADLSITGGSVDGFGGGVYVRAGGLFLLSRSRIFGCLARRGGGVGTNGGLVTIEDSELSNNFVVSNPPAWYSSGGGAYGGGGSSLVVIRSSIHDNWRDGERNGIDVWESSLSLQSSSVIDDDPPTSFSIRATDSDVEIVSSSIVRIEQGTTPGGHGSFTLGCSIVGYCSVVSFDIVYTNYGVNAFLSGADCVGPTDIEGSWGLLPLMAPYPGRFPARVPILFRGLPGPIDSGHAFVCLAGDQWSQTRPLDGDGDGIAIVDIGAVEAALLFFDGFESGGTSRWSSVQP